MAYRPRTRSPARQPGSHSLRARVMSSITHFGARPSSGPADAWLLCEFRGLKRRGAGSRAARGSANDRSGPNARL
jgi:hypothetical protein